MKTNNRHFVTDIPVSIEPTSRRKRASLLRALFARLDAAMQKDVLFCWGPFCVHRACEKKKKRDVVRDIPCPSGLLRKETVPFCYGHFFGKEALFCYGRVCVHRAYVKTKNRHFVTDIPVSIEPI